MARPSRDPSRSPIVHTAIIGDIGAMWSKLYWDYWVLRDLQVAYPNESEPLAYAALNVCVAAQSLRDWARARWVRRDKPMGRREADFYDLLQRSVPQQRMCDAVADTYKHGDFDDARWGGAVSLDWEAGEDAPDGFVLRHVGTDGAQAQLAVNEFDDLCMNWGRFLIAERLMSPEQMALPWFVTKMRAIFPPIDDDPPS